MRVQSTDNVELQVHVEGTGRPLIVVHGGPGMDDYTAGLDELAGPDLKVVRYEQRGVGRSTSPDSGAFGLRSYVEDLEAVRAAVAPEGRVHVLGHSWGGLVAMANVVEHGANVESLALIATVPPTGKALQAGHFRFQRRLERLVSQGLVSDASTFDALLPAYFHDPGLTPPPELQGIRVYPGVSEATWRAVTRTYDLTREVASISCPVLVLDGEGEPFGVEASEAAAAALTSAQVRRVTLAACGHFWHEQRQAFFEELRAFLLER
jgi:proline iminopeptidase